MPALPRRKRSEGKATWPGRKQVWRRCGADGRMAGDVLTLADHDTAGEPLIHPVMRGGKRLGQKPSLDEIRQHAKRELERLPKELRQLEPGAVYQVEIGDDLVKLAADVDRRQQTQSTAGR